MKIAICFKEVIDSTIDLGYGRVDQALVSKALAYRLDPADIDCLSLALSIKARNPQSEITLVSIGGESAESYLRDGLAVGADKALRIWDESFFELSQSQLSKIISSAISLLGSDLVLCGSQSLDSGSGLVGALTAAWLDWPFVAETVEFELDADGKKLNVIRNVDRGLRERLVVGIPTVLAVRAGGRSWPYASLVKMLDSLECRIDLWSLSDLGISQLELKELPAASGHLSFPRPPTKVAPLNCSLPAFDRILALLEGGLTLRRGQVLKGSRVELVEQLYQLLIKEEILKTKDRP